MSERGYGARVPPRPRTYAYFPRGDFYEAEYGISAIVLHGPPIQAARCDTAIRAAVAPGRAAGVRAIHTMLLAAGVFDAAQDEASGDTDMWDTRLRAALAEHARDVTWTTYALPPDSDDDDDDDAYPDAAAFAQLVLDGRLTIPYEIVYKGGFAFSMQ